jgi:hypothetical protein
MTSRDYRELVKEKATASLFGAIIAVLDKHEAEHTLTPEILETLAQAYAATVTGGVPDQPRLGS